MSTDDAYTAGMLDADGSIGLYSVSTYVQVQVAITGQDVELMRWLTLTYNGRWGLSGRVYHWHPNDPVDFLSRILPYLRLKKEQAELVIEWRKISRGARISDKQLFIQKSKDLNARTKVVFDLAKSVWDEAREHEVVGGE